MEKSKCKDKKREKRHKPTPKEDRPDYSELIKYVPVISKPLADRKLTKRLYETVRKASEVKTFKEDSLLFVASEVKILRRGIREVVKAIKKGEKGIVVIGGDVTPIDVISHIPVMCKDRDLPYCYVPSKVDLGIASMTKRPTSVVMLKTHAEIGEKYEKCFSEMKSLPIPM